MAEVLLAAGAVAVLVGLGAFLEATRPRRDKVGRGTPVVLDTGRVPGGTTFYHDQAAPGAEEKPQCRSPGPFSRSIGNRHAL